MSFSKLVFDLRAMPTRKTKRSFHPTTSSAIFLLEYAIEKVSGIRQPLTKQLEGLE